MPQAPKRPCSFPGCPELVDAGRCQQHRRAGSARFERRARIRRRVASVPGVGSSGDYPELRRVESNCMGALLIVPRGANGARRVMFRPAGAGGV